jgi:hypothetical protein
MRRLRTVLALGMPALAALWMSAPLGAARATPQEGISLMNTLKPWTYPDSEMPGGASMSDGGNPRMQSIKCQAVLTTRDPIDKVIAFYASKLVAAAEPGEEAGRDALKDRDKDKDAKSVSIQNDSKGRPVTVQVIVVNKAESSTTLVISRAEGEKETHIAWTHYIRLGNKL